MAESRGKSVPLILLLTLIFSWIVTLILAFVKKEKEARIPKYFIPTIIGRLIIAAIPSFLATYAEYTMNRVEPVYDLESDITQDEFIGPMIDFEEFIVNIISAEGNRYLKAEIIIEVDKEETREEINRRMPMMRDIFVLGIENHTYEELQTFSGKRQLKTYLIERINSFLHTGCVKSLHFAKFEVN